MKCATSVRMIHDDVLASDACQKYETIKCRDEMESNLNKLMIKVSK